MQTRYSFEVGFLEGHKYEMYTHVKKYAESFSTQIP